MSNRYHKDWKLNQYYETLFDFKEQLSNYYQFKQKFQKSKDIHFSEDVDDLVEELTSNKNFLLSEGVNQEDIFVKVDYGFIEMVYFQTETQEEFTKRLELQIGSLQKVIDEYEKELSGVGK